MPELFVEKTIEIDAPASKIWHVLTSPEHSGEKYHRLSAEVWDRVLPKVKALAEKEKGR